jgi:predicted  nucleic acid-binding Zn ribbon protein
MAQRGISETVVTTTLAAGTRVAEAAPAGAPRRWRYTGRVNGRRITIIVADEETELVVITAF